MCKVNFSLLILSSGVESAGSSSSSSSNVANPKTLSEMVRVRSFNYKSISLAYGPSFDAYCTVRYSPEKKAFAMTFGKYCNINIFSLETSSLVYYFSKNYSV